MEPRERRRDRDWRYGARARREHLRVVHPDGVVDCACERSAFFFKKRKSVGCNCRGRTKSNPKFGRGPCARGWRPAVRERIEGRRMVGAWLTWVAGARDLSDCEI